MSLLVCRDWHTGSVLCKQKVAADTSSLVFTEDSSHILAAGKSGIKVRRMCRHTESGRWR